MKNAETPQPAEFLFYAAKKSNNKNKKES